eukprot:TRINITY_DN12924_c1_g1_i3.p1 TRINITY_DN12924_c1_g1~~TRINITY_DN12924_c1_g1_i3.p1  ORF type:complete len:215 (+),score=78.91 TRINITY_DN12924_c1_g1_i3:526-1170(+)
MGVHGHLVRPSVYLPAKEQVQNLMMLTSAHFADEALGPVIARNARAALSSLYSQWHRDWFTRRDYEVLKSVVKRALHVSGACHPKRKSEMRRARLVQRRRVFKQRKRLYEDEEKHRVALQSAGLQHLVFPPRELCIRRSEHEGRAALEDEFGALIGAVGRTRQAIEAADATMQRSIPILSDFLDFLEKEYDGMLEDLQPPPLPLPTVRPVEAGG